MTETVSLAIVLFLMIDSIGAIPTLAGMLKDFDLKKQYKILVRELLLGLAAMLVFCYAGHAILEHMGVKIHSVQLSGGIILFLLGLSMLFKKEE